MSMRRGAPRLKKGKVRRRPKTDDSKETNCIVCGTSLGITGGMGGTGMCGPCCTGEAATLDERGETCLGNEAVAASFGEPGKGFHVFRLEHDAIGDFGLAAVIEFAPAALEIEPTARHRGIGHFRRVPVLKLEEAAFAAAVTNGFPFALGHFSE